MIPGFYLDLARLDEEGVYPVLMVMAAALKASQNLQDRDRAALRGEDVPYLAPDLLLYRDSDSAS